MSDVHLGCIIDQMAAAGNKIMLLVCATTKSGNSCIILMTYFNLLNKGKWSYWKSQRSNDQNTGK